MRRGTAYALEVHAKLPDELARMPEIAGNLWYSWNRHSRDLFSRLNMQLWEAVGHSPGAFLRQVDEERLRQAAADPEFMSAYRQVLHAYDSYQADKTTRNRPQTWRDDDLVAYFCAEFGFHESLPIYSGGLGILAGDYCKAASDARVPFVGIGLLYRQGYFTQTMDSAGGQIVTYADSDFSSMPVSPVMTGDAEMRVQLPLPGRTVTLRVWQAQVGHAKLYFLDSDVAENDASDRTITFRLYGGDRKMRLEQEIVLGMGGVRVLAALNIKPSVWHINEGHAAFMILERVRELVAQGISFDGAVESVASCLLFTTHTSVPAGHDRFDLALISDYFSSYCRDVGIDMPKLIGMGRSSEGADFDMTTLAIRGSRQHNAVSRLHGSVTAQMLQNLWPDVPAEENPVGYVTNGVHMPTFLAPEWGERFEHVLGAGWNERLDQGGYLERLMDMPDRIFWSVHQQLKAQMLQLLRRRVSEQHMRNGGSAVQLQRRLRNAVAENPNVLTIGFARRFATYKRAELLLNDLKRLSDIVSQAGRPVLFIFAGKAHPADVPGQDVIRDIARIAKTPEFEDKILLVEGYDLHLARRLVSGVDLWLNNPIHRLEASGTSGMKAGMNGVINLSVLDGWWDEGYEPGNGWAISASTAHDADSRDRDEASALYDILQDQAIPLYYARDEDGSPTQWIHMAKRSMATILPQFNAARMLNDYVYKFYVNAAQQGRRYGVSACEPAIAMSQWKSKIRAAWPRVTLTRIDQAPAQLPYGADLDLAVMVQLAGLTPDDVVVELTLERPPRALPTPDRQIARFVPVGAPNGDGVQRYELKLAPSFCGTQQFSIRAYPYHELLTHRFELGLMVWA